VTFFAPWAAWFLAGIPVIVLLYLLKLKRRPVAVSTLMFWQRVMQESRRRALFQRLRNLFSLLLHLLIFLLIVGALAKPALDQLVWFGSSLVIVLDTRARMQALEDDGHTRFERARASAARLVREAGAGREIAIIAAGPAPSVAVPFTSDEKRLREAIEALAPTDATGDLPAAERLAEGLLASRSGGRKMVVITDRDDPQTPDFISVATPRDNVAITRFATRPLPNSPQTSEVLLEIRNFAAVPANGNLELHYDGRLLDVKPFTLPPGGQRLEIFPSVPRPSRSARGWLTAHLDAADALPLDNTAYAILPSPKTRRVLLVSNSNWFLEKLLAADPGVSFELLAPDAYKTEIAAKFDVVILDDLIPPDFSLAQPGANFLFIGKSPFGTEAIEQPVITDVDAQHPLLRLVNLQGVTFLRATALVLPEDPAWSFSAPLRSFEHPLLLAGEQRGKTAHRIAAFAFTLTDSDLPLRIAFPLLMANTLQWLAGEANEAPPAIAAGEALVLGPAESVATEPLTSPDAAPPQSFAGGFFQPLRQGYYQRMRPGGSDWIAVNAFSETESDLRNARPGPSAAHPSWVPVSLARAAGWPLWRYLALAAFALLAMEWHLFHRRRTE
jgi:hypothetical protein